MSATLPLLPGRLAAPYPVLLLPVGVQAKFMRSEAGARQLWVRIYPDQLSISTHEAALTAEEQLAGQAWHASPQDADYWRGLVARYGAPRAQWVVRQTAPGAPAPATATASWTRAAEARGLPQRFAVLLYRAAPTLADVAAGPAKNLLFPAGRPYEAAAVPRPTTEFLQLCKAQEGLDIDLTQGLAVGLAPQADGRRDPAAVDGVDAANRWTVDFAAACAAGMAVVLDLSDLDEAVVEAGFARLVVVGVRPAAATGEPLGHRTLAGLLTDHAYTSGAQLVAQGTPTNNTDTAPAGYSSAERSDADATLGLLTQATAFDDALAWAERPDGHHLARTLGLADADLPPLAGARAQRDTAEAVAFNRALWPATYGYFLEEMLRPLLSAPALAWTRDLFENYVLARGVAPALRVGAQPYGVLPTTRFSAWETDPLAPGHAYATQLQAVLGQLDAAWTERLNPQPGLYPAATVGGAVPAPDGGSLLSTLGLDATSGEYYQRYLIGPILAEALQAHAADPASAVPGEVPLIWAGAQRPAGPYDATANPVYQEFARLLDPANAAHLQRTAQGNQPVAAPPIFGHTFQSTFTKLAEAFADEPGARRQQGVLIDEAPLSETEKVAPLPGVGSLPTNYLQWLGTASFDDIRLEKFDSSQGDDFVPPTALLYQLLRQAVLLEYWGAAKRYLALRGDTVVYDGETFNVETPGQTPRWAWLYKDVGTQKLYQVLAAGPLAGYLAGVAQLGDLSTARLERLLAEHLDLGSYRLDAWRLAPVAQRLRTLRATQPVGSHLGAFGWLEDLRPTDPAVPADDDGLLADPDNLGYVHTPGLAHAAAAALLRQGYKSRQLTADPTDPVAGRMAVDISSRRTRAALALLTGLRGGSSLGTLLGQRFERAVQQHAGLADGQPYASYLPLFRRAFPLSDEHVLVAAAGQPAPTGLALAQATRQVVDGAALLRAAAATPAYPHGVYGAALPAAGTDFARFITAELARLTDELDALGDLGVSEGIFQAARGNPDRAAAVLDGVAQGLFPPEPDFVHPPQAGLTLTQRVLVQLPAPLPTGSGWPAATPRAQVTPRLNAWLAQFFPAPSGLQLQVRWGAASPAPAQSVALAAAGLHPIDLLYLLQDNALQAGSDFDRLALYALAQAPAVRAAKPAGSAELALDYAGPGAAALRRLLPLLARLRQLLGAARPARPHDLQAPGDLAADHPDAGVLAPALAARLAPALTALAPLGVPGATLTAAELYQAARYGVAEALPGLAPAADLEAATRQVRAALAPRLAAAQALPAAPTLADLLAQASALFGPGFWPDVEFALAPPAADAAQQAAQLAYEQALDPSRTTQLLRHHASQPLALQEWLHGLGAVREPLNHLDKVFLIQSLLDPAAEPILALRPAQLTATPTPADYWLGLPWPDDASYTPPADALSLVQWLPAGYQPGATQCALWLDEWTETLPVATHTTALALHYDQPNAAAPQAMLLVVQPRAQAADWTMDDLLGAVNETLDLAKKRTVEPASLALTPLATVLPAVVAPVAQQAVTLTLDLGRVNASARFSEAPLLVPPLP